MHVFTDQLDRDVSLPGWPPQRIISLVPSQTELLYELGLENEVVGITKFCVHPLHWFREKTHIGGTKTLNFQKIAALRPDLIIGNKEENEFGQIAALAEQFPVWLSDVRTLEAAWDMMRRIGALTGKATQAADLVQAIQAEFLRHGLPATDSVHPGIRAAYFIWRKPWMVAGDDTFIDAVMQTAGFENVFAGLGRYPEISMEQLAAAQPEHILLSSEPYPFAEKHVGAFLEICPQAKVRIVDGELFSWYGSRLRYAPAYLSDLRKVIFDQK